MEKQDQKKMKNKTEKDPRLVIFKKVLNDTMKDNKDRENKRKNFPQVYKSDSSSQNSDSSKDTSNESTVVDNCVISSQEKILLPNNIHEDHTKQNSRHKQPSDQNYNALDIQISSHPRSCFNNSDECNNDDHKKISLKFNGQKCSNNYKEKSCNNPPKPSIYLKQSVSKKNNAQNQIHIYDRTNPSQKYQVTIGHNYHENTSKSNINSNSLVDTSNVKTRKYGSEFKDFDSDQDFNRYAYKKHIQPKMVQDGSHRNNYKSVQHSKFQDVKFVADCRLDQSTEIQNYVEEDTISDNFRDNCVIVDTNIKHQRTFSDSNETIMNGKEKNMKVTFNVNDSESNSASSESNEPDSQFFSRSMLSVSSVSPDSNASSTVSLELVQNPSIYKPIFDCPRLTNDTDNTQDNSVIPPPVPCFTTVSENVYSNAETSLTSWNIRSETTDDDSHTNEDYFSLPDAVHLEAISSFITKIVEKRSTPNNVADTVIYDLNVLFKNYFEGNVIDYYGSYYCDLAITTSNINLMVQADVSIRKAFMQEIYRILSKELEKYHVYDFDEGETAYKSKIFFTHPNTGINCELTYLGKRGESFIKMGKFFKKMCRKDSRTKELIIACKVWAEHFNINEAEDGKLHPVGFALLVVHYLQHCENPVLPIYSSEEKDMEYVSCNDESIGSLWLGFLWYYAFIFNWEEDVLTVTSKGRISKKSKMWERYWIAIEDPFTEKNIALSVINKDVADYIKCCFKKTYDYFRNTPEIIPFFDDEENQSSNESNNPQIKFSFNDCIVEQTEDFCERCDEIGDTCDECQTKIYVQPEIACVPKMTDEFLKVVKNTLIEIYGKYILSEDEICQRKQFVKNLESNVRKIYPDAQMRLFGSSANGFGFKKSDLDICMTFESKKHLKSSAVLIDLRKLLRRDKDFVNVIAIFNATIPILKFRYEPKGWRGDISLDNVLAVHNSELLYTYSLIDERCKILGCALKLLAKKALIADVTEKALSSYSYLIMVIHFLQQTNPPVLPVLQDNQFRMEEYDLNDIIESCNVWFCRDLKHIRNEFKTDNNTPVEQLFLDLLDYYCFIDCNQVITIRQKEIKTISQKMLLARLFQIQDPFIETKNLGCVVSPSKAHEIKNVLNRARMLFRTPKKDVPKNDLENYFFSTMSLTGRIYKESLCDFCGKFGHDQNNCTHSLPKKKLFFNHVPRKHKYVYQKKFFKSENI